MGFAQKLRMLKKDKKSCSLLTISCSLLNRDLLNISE